jgi:hypothetical protein
MWPPQIMKTIKIIRAIYKIIIFNSVPHLKDPHFQSFNVQSQGTSPRQKNSCALNKIQPTIQALGSHTTIHVSMHASRQTDAIPETIFFKIRGLNHENLSNLNFLIITILFHLYYSYIYKKVNFDAVHWQVQIHSCS